MKITVRIPTTQYGFIEAEGTEKDLPKMTELHNKYCVEKLVEIKRPKEDGSASPAEQN